MKTKIEMEISKVTSKHEVGKADTHKVVMTGCLQGIDIKMEMTSDELAMIEEIAPIYPGRPVAVTIEDNQAVLQQWASQEAAHNATEVSR